jgi:hypothetical protein
MERFFSGCSSGDSSETQIPFGNDKQNGKQKEAALEGMTLPTAIP